SFELPFGRAHVFYPEASDERCTAALLLDVDPVGLIRRGVKFPRLDQYVNDRRYVACSFMSVGLAGGVSTALGGQCSARAQHADEPGSRPADGTSDADTEQGRRAAEQDAAEERRRNSHQQHGADVATLKAPGAKRLLNVASNYGKLRAAPQKPPPFEAAAA